MSGKKNRYIHAKRMPLKSCVTCVINELYSSLDDKDQFGKDKSPEKRSGRGRRTSQPMNRPNERENTQDNGTTNSRSRRS